MSAPLSARHARHARLGTLDVITVAPAEPATPDTLHVVLCHGYGAGRDDLVPLAGELLHLLPAPSRARVRFHFPGAPLDAPGGMGAAWWQLDMERMQSLMRGDGPTVGARRNEVPDGLDRARRALTGCLDALLAREKTTWSRVILGGFSQGAMLTTDVALRLDEPPAALFVLSGTLLMQDQWTPRMKARAGLKVVLSHGTQDPLLAFADAEALRDLMQAGGMQVTWVPFRGPHTIVGPALKAMADHVGALLSAG